MTQGDLPPLPPGATLDPSGLPPLPPGATLDSSAPKIPNTQPATDVVQKNMAAQEPPIENAQPPTDGQKLDAGAGFPVTAALKGGIDALPTDHRDGLIQAYEDGSATDASDYMQNVLPAMAKAALSNTDNSIGGVMSRLAGGTLQTLLTTAKALQESYEEPLGLTPEYAKSIGALDNPTSIKDWVKQIPASLLSSTAVVGDYLQRVPQAYFGAVSAALGEVAKDAGLTNDAEAWSTQFLDTANIVLLAAGSGEATGGYNAQFAKATELYDAGHEALKPVVGEILGKPPEQVTPQDTNQAIAKGFENAAPKAQDFHTVAAVMDHEANQPLIPNFSSEEAGNGLPSDNTLQTSSPGTQSPSFQTSDFNLPSGVFTTRATSPSIQEGDVGNASSLDIETPKDGIVSGLFDTSSVYHTRNNVQELKAKAEEAEPDLRNLLETISKNIEGASFYGTRLKDEDSLNFKLQSKDANKVSDFLGGRIIVDTPEAANKVVEQLKSTGSPIAIDNFLDDGSSSGYRAIHVQIMGKDGLSAEVQIQPKEISDETSAAHALYKEAQRARSEGDDSKALELTEKQKELYDNAWDKWKERTGKAQAENFAPTNTVDTLHNIYKETGVHPDQVWADAKKDPSIAADVRAGRVPAAYEHLKEQPPENGGGEGGGNEPPGEEKGGASSGGGRSLRNKGDRVEHVSDELFRNANQRLADKIEILHKLQDIQNIPEATFEKLQRYEETPDKVSLTPEEQELYDKFFKPIKEESTKLAQYIMDHGSDPAQLLDEGYTPRQAKGKGGPLDTLDNPKESTTNIKGKSLSTGTPSEIERQFFAVDTAEGRKLVSVDKDGKIYDVFGKKDAEPIGELTDKNAIAGSKIQLNGKEETLGHATIGEIENATDLEFHKNLLGTRITNLLDLRRTARNIEMIERWKTDPEMQKAVVWEGKGAEIPPGFRQLNSSSLPNEFRGAFFEPNIANALEDFLPKIQDDTTLNKIEKIGQFTRASMFFNPVKHMANVTFQYLMSKGLVGTLAHPFSTAAHLFDAFHDVITQSEDYQDYLKDGTSLPYAKQIAAQFPQELQRAMGRAIDANPTMMTQISKLFGYANPVNWVRAIYKVSNKALFSYGDALAIARIKDLEGQGLSRQDAIAEAERVLPSYRVPQKVLGSRAVSQALQSPLTAEFGRYQYNRLRSFAEVMSDIFGKDRSLGERAHGFDQAMFVAVMMSVGYPLLDKLAQQITGNNEASVERSGDAKVVQNALDWANGKKDIHQALMSTFSPGMLTAPVEAFVNTNFYTGQHIVPENDLRQGHLGRAAYDLGHFALGQVSPAQDVMQQLEGKSDLEHFLENQAMINNPTQQQLKGQKMGQAEAKKEQSRAAKKRPAWLK